MFYDIINIHKKLPMGGQRMLIENIKKLDEFGELWNQYLQENYEKQYTLNQLALELAKLDIPEAALTEDQKKMLSFAIIFAGCDCKK